MVRTIKFLQMLLILSVVSVLSLSGAHASTLKSVGGGGGAGGDFPWPWDFAVRFPWDEVEGVWRAEKDGKIVYFMFRRVQAKRIKIKQIDIDTCEVIGSGQGFERAKTVIVAQMMDSESGDPYNFTLYAFNEEDSPEPPIVSKIAADQVIVVRINSFMVEQPEFTAQMARVSDRLEMVCGPAAKKIKF